MSPERMPYPPEVMAVTQYDRIPCPCCLFSFGADWDDDTYDHAFDLTAPGEPE